jgi:adenylosuccinate synthase
MAKIIQVDFVRMGKGDLEYILDDSEIDIPKREFVIISPQEARKLYLERTRGKTNVYVPTGAQKGDEGKGMALSLIEQCDPSVKWSLEPNSTHNAGKGVHTLDPTGKPVKVSLHLAPATLVNPEAENYIGSQTQTNLFSLRKEVLGMQEKTGHRTLGQDYHLMVDSYVNLVVPTNRADDVVGKKNAMGSTVVGATLSASNATGKTAPLLEHVLHDPAQFKSLVEYQIRDFEGRLKHDKEFRELGLTNLKKLGYALNSVMKSKERKKENKFSRNIRLRTLAEKLSQPEIQFFSEANPAQFLLEQYKGICESGLFYIGDCKKEINDKIERGEPGIIESVQSTLLSGPVKFSRNRTAAGTNSSATIGDAGLNPENISYKRLLVFKYANTSVGGNDITMSGFIKQDALYSLEAEKNGKKISFEKTETLEEFLPKEDLHKAFHEINEAFFYAFKNGLSVRNSRARIKGINMEMSLAEARALLTAYKWGEKGETSGRARICRFDDLVETGIVYNVEGRPLQIRNALDRAIELPKIGIVTGYKVVREYGGYNVGDIIKPGMPLRQEHLTTASCVPIVSFMPTWKSITADGNKLIPGAQLNENLANYLSLVSDGSQIFAIGAGARLESKAYIKELK